MRYDVFGMCNPLYDIQAEVSDSFLDALGFARGSMQLIDEAQQTSLVSGITRHIVNAEPGGSGANTMIGIAMLGGRACYTGKVATDAHGTLYLEGLASRGVHVPTPPGAGVTGMSVILITPDAERTMCTFLGICRDLTPGDIDLDALRASRYLYVTGYLWDTETQKAAVLHAMQSARAAGVKVALSLSDPFCVHRHKDDFLRIVHAHVDIVIGNDEEAMALTDTSSPSDAITALAPCCDFIAITMGARGSLLHRNGISLEVPAFPVHAVDTTGAGDMYASGLLYGLTHGLDLHTTGRLGAALAAQVVGKLGPRLDQIDTVQLDVNCPGWRKAATSEA